MIEIKNNNFKLDELNLMYFTGTYCAPCKVLKPILEKISLDEKYVIGKVDVDDNNELVEQYNIMSVPTLIFLKDGKEVLRKIGLQQENVILAQLESL